jgi:hypothetical protein
MAALPIVPQDDFLRGRQYVDVLKQIGLDRVAALIAAMKYPLVLHAVEPAFDRRIVPLVALSAHAGNCLHFLNQCPIVVAAILPTPVAAMQPPRLWFAPEARHPQSVEYQLFVPP